MSRVTPEEEYAAGIVSCASHAPLANSAKSVHTDTVVSIQRMSTTLSGGHSLPNAARDTGAAPEERKVESYRAREAWSKDGAGAGLWRVLVHITTWFF